jgi:hypothetical protein
MEELKEVIITDKKYNNDIRSPEMSLNKLSISSIKKNACVLGEVMLKSLLLLPGVTNAGEGHLVLMFVVEVLIKINIIDEATIIHPRFRIFLCF